MLLRDAMVNFKFINTSKPGKPSKVEGQFLFQFTAFMYGGNWGRGAFIVIYYVL